MNLTDPNIVLNALNEANGSVVGLIVQFDFVTKADLKVREKHNIPYRVDLFRHMMSAKGLKVEYLCATTKSIKFAISR